MPSVSMSVSITTPGSQIPSIHSQLATIISKPPCKILTHDVNKLLSYLHNTNTAHDVQHAELTDHLCVIEDELLGKIEDMLQELLNRAAVPPPVPPPPPTEPEMEEGSSELSSGILCEHVEAILQRHGEPLPQIHQPTPVHVSRSEHLFPNFQAASIPSIAPVPPPPLVPFMYHPTPWPP